MDYSDKKINDRVSKKRYGYVEYFHLDSPSVEKCGLSIHNKNTHNISIEIYGPLSHICPKV